MSNLRITATVSTSADSLAKTLRSIAARVDVDALVPGADIEVNGVRIQVADKQVSDIRAWARENADTLAEQGITVGGRGRYSKALTDAYAAHLKAERKRVRDERAARKAAAAAQAETVNA